MWQSSERGAAHVCMDVAQPHLAQGDDGPLSHTTSFSFRVYHTRAAIAVQVPFIQMQPTDD